MSIGEKAPAPPPAHRIVLSDRQHLAVSGVEGVESFDEATIVLTTSEGSLIVRGEGLHIEKLSLDGGDLLVEGTVESLTYEEEEPHQSLFGRLFRGCASPSPASCSPWRRACCWAWAWACSMIFCVSSACWPPAAGWQRGWTCSSGSWPAWRSFSAVFSSAAGRSGCIWSSG